MYVAGSASTEVVKTEKAMLEGPSRINNILEGLLLKIELSSN